MTIALAPHRVDALHGTGIDVRGTSSAFDALADADLAGWDVQKYQLRFENGTPLRGVQGLRKGNGYPLHGLSVGDRYQVVQYEQNAELLDAVAAETGATFDTSGELDGGCRAFLSMKLPDQLIIGSGDSVDAYVVAFMGHGKVANVFAPTAVRTWCANQQLHVTRGNKYKVTIRHTRNAVERMQVARSTLVATVSAFRELAEEAERMLQVRLAEEKFRRIVDGLYPLGGGRPVHRPGTTTGWPQWPTCSTGRLPTPTSTAPCGVASSRCTSTSSTTHRFVVAMAPRSLTGVHSVPCRA